MERLHRVWFLLVLITLLTGLDGCKGRVERIPIPPESSGVMGRPTPVVKTPQPTLPEKRLVTLEWPQKIYEQDSDLIVLSIQMDESGQVTPTVQGAPGTPIEIPNLYTTHNIFALARLDMAGMNAFSGDIREPLLPGRPVTFQWSIRAGAPGLYKGVVWLHIEMIPKNGGPTEQQFILARPIETQAVTVFGLPPVLARWFGGIGLVVSTLLGYPFVQRWLEPLFKRRRRSARRQHAAPGKEDMTHPVTNKEDLPPEVRR